MNERRAHSKIGKHHEKQFLILIVSSNPVPLKKIAVVTRGKAKEFSKLSKLTMFVTMPNPDFQKTDMEKALQVMRAPLALATYAEKPFVCASSFELSSAPEEDLWI